MWGCGLLAEHKAGPPGLLSGAAIESVGMRLAAAEDTLDLEAVGSVLLSCQGRPSWVRAQTPQTTA